MLGPRNIGHESGFLADCQPRIVGWSYPKSFAVGFGQTLERALILIGGARSCPGLSWKPAWSPSRGALVTYRARPSLLASAKSPRLQLKAYSLHPQSPVGGLSRQSGLEQRSSWCYGTLAQQIIQAELASFHQKPVTKSVTAFCLHYASRLNSGVRAHANFFCNFVADPLGLRVSGGAG